MKTADEYADLSEGAIISAGSKAGAGRHETAQVYIKAAEVYARLAELSFKRAEADTKRRDRFV